MSESVCLCIFIVGIDESYIDVLALAVESQLFNTSIDSDGILVLNGVTDVFMLPLSSVQVHFGRHFVLSSWLRLAETNSVVQQLVCLTYDVGSSAACQLSISFEEKSFLVLSMHPENIIGDSVARKGKLGPSLWKWRLHQIADESWHHYTIVVRYPQVF